MNIKQLVALWYTNVVVLTILFSDGWGIDWLSRNESAIVTIGAIIFGGLVIFTLQSSNQFDYKIFFKWMSVPAILLVALFGVILYQEIQRTAGTDKVPAQTGFKDSSRKERSSIPGIKLLPLEDKEEPLSFSEKWEEFKEEKVSP